MLVFLSSVLRGDVNETVRQALRDQGLVNVSRLAEEVRQRNEAENVALEDIEACILMFAHSMSAAMEFERATDIPVARRGPA